MAIVEKNKECCGCGACSDICPKKAITMKEDDETFLYPKIDNEKCINCNLCEKVCPLNFNDFQSPGNVKSFIGTYDDKKVIFDSSSGGAFTAICQIYIQKGYIIYGAQYDKHLRVVHDSANTFDGCQRFRKSKYVQSNTEGCFFRIADELKKGEKVLFSGVSCQVAALCSYLKAKNISSLNLITVNVLCHGVPSQKIFDEYIKEEEKREGSSICVYKFKNKEPNKGKINSRTSYIEFENGHNYIKTIKNDPFLRGYYRRLFYRPSCMKCHFTCKERISDYTIADAWNIEEIYPDLNPIEGISLLTLNTKQAINDLPELKKYMLLNEISSDWALNSQALFREPTSSHKNRDKFFERWKKKSFRKAVFLSTKPTVKHYIGLLIPSNIKNHIKLLMHIH